MMGKMALTASIAHLNPVSSGWTAQSLFRLWHNVCISTE